MRSLEMDSWEESEIKMMKAGGNQRLLDFFKRHNIERDAPISLKYNTKTAELYRTMLLFLSAFTVA